MLKTLAKKYNLQHHINLLEELSSPCLQARESTKSKKIGYSKVGGLPHANKDFNWPNYQGRPIEFIAQLNLAELSGSNLPNNGILLFFYADGTWADKRQHKDFIRVIHIQETDNLLERQPEFFYRKRLFGLLKPRITPQVFDEYSVSFFSSESLPDLDNVDSIPALSIFENDDSLSDSYCDLKWELSEQSILQIGGYPNPVQYDGIATQATSIIGKGSSSDWELLLEVDSKLGFMWGDAGKLHFFIHKDDLRVGKFSDVWMEFQCH